MVNEWGLQMIDIFQDPLFTPREVAKYLSIPQPTIYSWLRPVEAGPQLVHRLAPERRGAASVPFAALVEAYVLRALRQLGLSKHQIRAVVADVRKDFGNEYALATKHIATDGIDVFIQYVDGEMSRAGDRQIPIREVITDYLRYVTFDAYDGEYASRLRLKSFGDDAPVIIDPRFGWGAPVIEKNGVPVRAVIDLWSAGEPMRAVADEYDLTVEEVESICQAALATA